MLKENPRGAPGKPLWQLLAGVGLSLALLAGVLHQQDTLPASRPIGDQPHLFSADNAYDFLVNLTSIGPRVAGSYENEELAPRVVLQALQSLSAGASQHNRIHVELHRASGAFPIKFFDGMSNVYRDVGMVVARLTPAGTPPARPAPPTDASRPPRPRRALLLNCHYDTVPDSPGAMDDGAGCAVLVEAARALLAAPLPAAADLLLLLNGAEENIMQASHAFLTTHRWGKLSRVFVNLEACGAGGREVLFQAGPREPWLLDVYSAWTPRPLLSSVAQELFASGAVPGDTDFRIFRDYGNMSGVDLAWASNGYVYHTLHDALHNVPRGSLQRTGDNVLALVHGILESPRLGGGEAGGGGGAGLPVFFDVLGRWCVTLQPAPAAAAAAALLALAVAAAATPNKHAYMSRGAYFRVVCVCGVKQAASVAAGAAAGGLLPALLPVPLLWLCRPALLAALAAAPGVCVAWLVSSWLHGATSPLVRYGAAGRGAALLACVAAALGALCGVRSAFVPGVVGAALLAALLWRPLGALGALPALALSADLLRTFVPIMGRAGSDVPADLVMGVVTAALTLLCSLWLLPVALCSRHLHTLVWCVLCACVCVWLVLLRSPPAAPYSPACPQRVMLFRTRRTLHAGAGAGGEHDHTQLLYWMPHMDANFPHAAYQHWPELKQSYEMSVSDCESMLWCGAPYYLPVRTLLPRAHWLPDPAQHDDIPLRLHAQLNSTRVDNTTTLITIKLSGCHHIVAIVSPPVGARVSASSLLPRPQPGARWADRDTYMFFLHDAASHTRPWDFTLTLTSVEGSGRGAGGAAGAGAGAALSLACHGLAHPRSASLAARLRTAPATLATTGWDVDLHLYTL